MTIEHFVHTLKHHWQTAAFFCGFLTDILWLNQVDSVLDNATILCYVFLATLSLLLLYAGIAQRFGEAWSRRAQTGAGIVMQYSFGGLFSGMLILYGRSGDMVASWPFLILFVGGMVANELLKQREEKLIFNLVSYFIGVFSYLVMGITVLTGLMGPMIFVGSGVIALTLVYVLVKILARIIPRYLELEMRKIVFSVASAFVILNTLYFTNVIPPIPLSLTEISIAQSVVRFPDVGTYEVTYEPKSWFDLSSYFYTTFHPSAIHAVSCFTRVYAPVRLETKVVHVWKYKDPTTGTWQQRFKLAYPISGKARHGYRGYTSISTFADGTWQCSVETERGQVIGRRTFIIDSSQAPTSLMTKTE